MYIYIQKKVLKYLQTRRIFNKQLRSPQYAVAYDIKNPPFLCKISGHHTPSFRRGISGQKRHLSIFLRFYLLSTLLRGQFGNKFSAVLMNWPSEARSIWINQGKFCRIDRVKGYLAVYYLAKILLRINNIASHFKITKQIRIPSWP